MTTDVKQGLKMSPKSVSDAINEILNSTDSNAAKVQKIMDLEEEPMYQKSSAMRYFPRNPADHWTNALIDISQRTVNYKDFMSLTPEQQEQILSYQGLSLPARDADAIKKYDRRAWASFFTKTTIKAVGYASLTAALTAIAAASHGLASIAYVGCGLALLGKLGGNAKQLLKNELKVREKKQKSAEKNQMVQPGESTNPKNLLLADTSKADRLTNIHVEFGKDISISIPNKLGKHKVVHDALKKHEKFLDDLHKEGNAALKERAKYVEKYHNSGTSTQNKLKSQIAQCDKKIDATLALLDRHQHVGDNGNSRSTELKKAHDAAKQPPPTPM